MPLGGSPPPVPDAVIVLGGGMHPDEDERHGWLRPELNWLAGLLETGTPLLGVCLGAQLVARLRANQTGADRLTRHEAALRQRLEVSGLKVGGLSIRAVDHGPDGFDLFAAQAAAAAYARGSASASASASSPATRAPDTDDEALP